MLPLEKLSKGATVKGLLVDAPATIIDVQWIGANVVEAFFKGPSGRVENRLLYREDENTLELVETGSYWAFDSDGNLFRLASEAQRIQLAHLFDPVLAVHSSDVEPLPHQILAVYEEMLPRQPLRFLLADDPGAGKTIMAGLFIRELIIRGDLKRCMIVCPGSLAEQWQDELRDKFDLRFEIITNEGLEAAGSGNWFTEKNLVICRLDKLSRNEDVQAKLQASEWDLIVCDEAHKMSASYFGGELKATKRYRLGQMLSGLTRHFLLMTATPHNGKNEDFQAFLALLDSDRFEGRYRDGVHTVDVSDLMRRLTKEHLRKFDGTPLFPERIAYTVGYKLSDLETALYAKVTDYVRQEFNRAESLASDGRKGTVGFALTILQRRLASSPEAIYQSLRRRRERLQDRLEEARTERRGAEVAERLNLDFPSLSQEQIEDMDDAPENEVETVEESVVDQASAARTIEELQAEISILEGLEKLALQVKNSRTDRKWDELSKLLQHNPHMQHPEGHRRKLVIFTEHRDTLNYLAGRLRQLIGRDEAIIEIHGSMGREERNKAREQFKQDINTEILVATDAAGEGINLQRAHLMVNYDLPWNPNRLEQRFGRIHRIGQTEVCHLWNLIAEETREGAVYKRLLEKLEQERAALKGGVFDILGKLFQESSLRDLLIAAVRYGDDPETRAKLFKAVDDLTDTDRCRTLLEDQALAQGSLDTSEIQRVRAEMERSEARRLQPHFIQSFFLAAFANLGGTIKERESRRFQITYVPSLVRHRDQQIGSGEPVLASYERVTFERSLKNVPGKPLATFVTPGHPLLGATISLLLERHLPLLRRGAFLVDKTATTEDLRVLFYLDHSIQDARENPDGTRRVISRRLQFVEIDAHGTVRNGGYAPYLDYRPLKEEEKPIVSELVRSQEWLKADSIEKKAIAYAIEHLVPEHFHEVNTRKQDLVRRTLVAVKDRLTKEIFFWNNRAEELKSLELAGRANAKLNSGNARQRAVDLEGRLKARLLELEKERQLNKQPPVIVGGALVIPECLLNRLLDRSGPDEGDELLRKKIERIAMETVLRLEQELGFHPRDVSEEKAGYDIESLNPRNGRLRFIEVKGRKADASTVTVTRNEVLTALNKPEDFILAIVRINGNQIEPAYVRKPFTNDVDFSVESLNFKMGDLLSQATKPS
jgi:superfamily II DNA or RNA helicase